MVNQNINLPPTLQQQYQQRLDRHQRRVEKFNYRNTKKILLDSFKSYFQIHKSEIIDRDCPVNPWFDQLLPKSD